MEDSYSSEEDSDGESSEPDQDSGSETELLIGTMELTLTLWMMQIIRKDKKDS